MQWHSRVFWSLWPVIAMAANSNYKLYKKWCLLNVLLLSNLKCVECIKVNLSLKLVILKPNLMPIWLCCLGQPQHSLSPSFLRCARAVMTWVDTYYTTLKRNVFLYTFNPLRPSWNEIFHLNVYEGKKTWKISSQVCGFVLSLSLCKGAKFFIWAEVVNRRLWMRSCWILVSCSISLWCYFSVNLLLPQYA